MLNPPTISRESSDSNYPSSLSIKYINSYGEAEVIGGCNRFNFYRRRGDTKTDKNDMSNILVMDTGKSVEETIVDYFKCMGIWRGNNIKFYDKIYNVAGEVDVFVELNGKLVIVELKTGYGEYFDKDVLGVSYKKKVATGYPKIEHIIQTAPYLEKYKPIAGELHLLYFNRGSFLHPNEFIITLNKEGILLVDGKPAIVSLRLIRERILELEDHIEQGKIPPRDYELKYSEEKAKKLVETKRRSEYWYNNTWKKDKGICGDWNCSYCDFKSKCWELKKNV
jgi:Holliday junction resolvase-like predicted endonuclease